MKKRFSKFLGLVLALVIAMGTFSGCNLGMKEDPNKEKVDETRTQIYLAAPDDGYGMAGYYAWKDMFEEEYKGVSFEEGKMGVQLMVDGDKMGYAGKSLISILGTTENEVFFSNMIAYHSNWDKFYDISDLIEEDLEDVGEPGKTIKGKMHDAQIDYYNKDNKFYALPHIAQYWGMNYSVELFDKNLLYFANNPDNGNDGFIRMPTEKKGTGPDGVLGTSDDGLPRTYDEFFKLCDRMERMGIDPWTMVAERYPEYVSGVTSAFWADYEGAEQAQLHYTLEGKAYNIVDTLNADGTFTVKGNGNGIDITTSNAWELYRQAGNYYALTFLEKIINGNNGKGYYADNAFIQSSTHTSIQADFLYSNVVPGVKPVAMLGEATWWYPESASVDETLSKTYPNASRAERKFRVLPLPKATEAKVGTKQTTTMTMECLAFMKKGIDPDKKEILEFFFKWCHTDRALKAFTQASGNVKDFNYLDSFTDTELAALPLWVQSQIEMLKNSDKVYAASRNPVYLAYPADFYCENKFISKIGSDIYKHPSTAFKDYDETAKDFFDGMKTYYTQSYWTSKYGDMF